MEDIRPIVRENYDFNYRVKSVITTSFKFWDHRDFDGKRKLIEFCHQILFWNCWVYDWDLFKRNEASSHREKQVGIPRLYQLYFRNFHSIQTLMRGSKTTVFQRTLLQKSNIFIGFTITGIKLVNIENNEMENKLNTWK